MTLTQGLLWYLGAINALALMLYGGDKARARNGAWRISERMLFAVALLGGSAGALAGMWLFHHKTKHWYFVVGIPAILLAQCALGVWALLRMGR